MWVLRQARNFIDTFVGQQYLRVNYSVPAHLPISDGNYLPVITKQDH